MSTVTEALPALIKRPNAIPGAANSPSLALISSTIPAKGAFTRVMAICVCRVWIRCSKDSLLVLACRYCTSLPIPCFQRRSCFSNKVTARLRDFLTSSSVLRMTELSISTKVWPAATRSPSLTNTRLIWPPISGNKFTERSASTLPNASKACTKFSGCTSKRVTDVKSRVLSKAANSASISWMRAAAVWEMATKESRSPCNWDRSVVFSLEQATAPSAMAQIRDFFMVKRECLE